VGPLERRRLLAAAIGLGFFALSLALDAVMWVSELSRIAGGAVALCTPRGVVVALPGAEGQPVSVSVACVGGGHVYPAEPAGNGSLACPPGYGALVEVRAPLGWPSASALVGCG